MLHARTTRVRVRVQLKARLHSCSGREAPSVAPASFRSGLMPWREMIN